MDTYIISYRNKTSEPIESESAAAALQSYMDSQQLTIRSMVLSRDENVTIRSMTTQREEHYYVRTEHLRLNQKRWKLEQERWEIIEDNWSSRHGVPLEAKAPKIILYHGSRDGIRGEIQAKRSRSSSDFAHGFYAGDRIHPSKLRLMAQGRQKLLYTLEADLSGLHVYTFDDEKDMIHWALYIAVHRGYIHPEEYPGIGAFVREIDHHDIVCGFIADDNMHAAFNAFMAGSITDKALAYCLTKAEYGHQYVFKTQKACQQIHFQDISQIQPGQAKWLFAYNRKIQESVRGVVYQAAKQGFEGRYFRDIIQEYT